MLEDKVHNMMYMAKTPILLPVLRKDTGHQYGHRPSQKFKVQCDYMILPIERKGRLEPNYNCYVAETNAPTYQLVFRQSDVEGRDKHP